MPLSNLQSEILRLLAAHRNPDSYVAGSTPLHYDGPRFSGDIDFFHPREELAAAALADTESLVKAGFTFQWLRQEPGIYAAEVRRRGESMKLEWVRDSDFRFFPLMQDDLFGYRLHVSDIATNKAMAAAGRQAPRDVLDLLYVHERHLPFGAVIWAAVERAPGFTPEGLIAEIRRNARYRADDYAALAMAEPVDANAVARRLRAALDEAETFARAGKEGLLFLKDGQPVQPDPEKLDSYVEHVGQLRGHWPSSSEIGSAMLERYNDKPKPCAERRMPQAAVLAKFTTSPLECGREQVRFDVNGAYAASIAVAASMHMKLCRNSATWKTALKSSQNLSGFLDQRFACLPAALMTKSATSRAASPNFLSINPWNAGISTPSARTVSLPMYLSRSSSPRFDAS